MNEQPLPIFAHHGLEVSYRPSIDCVQIVLAPDQAQELLHYLPTGELHKGISRVLGIRDHVHPRDARDGR